MILDKILADKEKQHTLRDPIGDWDQRIEVPELPPVPSLRAAIRAAGKRPAVIAEFKRRSPSAGDILPGGDVAEIAAAYARAGAAGVSILTEQKFFGGSLKDLAAARTAGVPLLRKDFVLFNEDNVDARHAGASAVLLIARILDDAKLKALLDDARSVGLEPLVEVHDEREMARAVAVGADLIGVNHRDLDTLAIDLSLSERLAAMKPAGALLVAESGLRGPEDLLRMRDCGCDAVLVGEALLRAPSPGDALAEWIAALG